MVDRQNIPGTIPRRLWGAEHPDGFGDRPLPVSEWWLHHSVTLGPDAVPPFTDDDAAIRTLERIGQNRFGGGISYTVPITPSGRSYVGHSFWRRGAHTQGHNTAAAAICFVGDYEANEPTDAMIREAARVMVEAHRLGLATRHTLNGGHRDLKSTACPGRKAYAAIGRINALAAQLWDRRDDGASRDDDREPPTKKAPEFPLGRGQYFGPRTPLSNENSVSGYYGHAKDLEDWQRQMRARRWSIRITGRYDAQTELVAREFQREKGLRPVDGLIGPDTWRAAWEAPVTR